MRYPVHLEGLSGHRIEVELQGALKGARLLVDGRPAPQGGKRNQYILRGADGRDSIAELKTSFLDPVPQVLWGGKKIAVAEALKWYQWIWCGLPILLVVSGGAIGGAIGGLGVGLNVRIVRSDMNGAMRYALTALISVAAVVTYVVLVRLCLMAIHR
jgi:hypothetical protein